MVTYLQQNTKCIHKVSFSDQPEACILNNVTNDHYSVTNWRSPLIPAFIHVMLLAKSSVHGVLLIYCNSELFVNLTCTLTSKILTYTEDESVYLPGHLANYILESPFFFHDPCPFLYVSIMPTCYFSSDKKHST